MFLSASSSTRLLVPQKDFLFASNAMENSVTKSLSGYRLELGTALTATGN